MTKIISFVIFLCISIASAQADVSDGLVGWWKLDEGSGTSAYDSSGQGTTASFVNTPTWISGKKYGALTFNGSDNYLDVGTGTIGITAGSTGLTLAAFVNVTTFQSYTVMIGKSEAGNPYGGWQINTNADTGNRFGGGINVSSTWTGITSVNTYTTGRWYHVAMTYDGTTLRLYVDGVQDTTETAAGTIQYSNAGSQVNIGRNPAADAPLRYLTGSVDDVRVYNRALSQTEINAINEGGRPRISVKGTARFGGFKSNL